MDFTRGMSMFLQQTDIIRDSDFCRYRNHNYGEYRSDTKYQDGTNIVGFTSQRTVSTDTRSVGRRQS